MPSPPRPARPRWLRPIDGSIVLALVLVAAMVATSARPDDTQTSAAIGEAPTTTTAEGPPTTTTSNKSTTTTEGTAAPEPTATTTPDEPSPSTTLTPATEWATVDTVPAGSGDRRWEGRGPVTIACVSEASACMVGGSMLDPAGVAHAAVLLSVDGGDTWTPALSSATPGGLSTLTCVPGGTCVAGGWSCDPDCGPAILASVDGGLTWNPARIGDSTTSVPATGDSVVRSVTCRTPLVCLATVGEPWAYRLLRSNDGGMTWVATPLPGGEAVAGARVYCAPNGPCLIGTTVYDQGLATYGTVHRSVDGIEWAPVDLPSPVAAMVNFACIDANRCHAAGTLPSGEAVVVTTDDSGRTWRQTAALTPPETGLHVAGIACPTSDACVVLLTNGIGTWQVQSGATDTWTTTDGPSGRVFAVACDPARTCLVIASPRAPDAPPTLLRATL